MSTTLCIIRRYITSCAKKGRYHHHFWNMFLVAVIISAERCNTGADNECKHTLCDTAYELHCVNNCCTCTESANFSKYNTVSASLIKVY